MTTQVDKSKQPKKTIHKDSEPFKKPVRVPLNRYRDLLTVFGKDPNFYYRWVKDTSDTGSNIMTHLQAGYQHVRSDDVTVGEDKVDRESSHGSIVRLNWKGETLYLMRQPMEFRTEDVSSHHVGVDEIDEHIKNPVIDPNDSTLSRQHGEVKIGGEPPL